MVAGVYVRLVYLSFPLGCVVVDTRDVKLSEICGRVDDDSHVFTTFGSLLSTLFSCAAEILDRGKIVDRTGEVFDTLDFSIDSHDSSEIFDNFER